MKKNRIIIFLILSLLSFFLLQTPALASSSVSITQNVVQSYIANSSVQLGMIVQIKNKAKNTVEPSVSNNITNMLGVVVPSTSTPVALIPSNINSQQVYVASSGNYDVLVSNQNGAINKGNYVTISSVNGIGMKANQNQSMIIGRADSYFNGKSNIVGSVTITDASGRKQQLAIGMIPVSLNVGHNPLSNKSVSYVPSFLFKIASTVVSKPVSAIHIYLSLLMLLLTVILVAVLLYSGIKSGMIAIGRNPLSRSSIIRSLVQTILAGLIIFVIGIFAVYLILKL